MQRIAALDSSETSDSDSDRGERGVTFTNEAKESEALSLYNKGLELLVAKKDEEAERVLLQLLNSDFLKCSAERGPGGIKGPNEAGKSLKYLAYTNIASVRARNGREAGAMDALLEAVAIDRSDVTVWFKLGKLAIKVYNFASARYAFEAGLSCSPRHWPCLHHLIPVLYASSDYYTCSKYVGIALERDWGYVQGLVFHRKIFSEEPWLKSVTRDHYKGCDQRYLTQEITEEDTNKYLPNALRMREKIAEAAARVSKPSRAVFDKPITSFTWANLGLSLSQLHDKLSNAELPGLGVTSLVDMSAYENLGEETDQPAVPTTTAESSVPMETDGSHVPVGVSMETEGRSLPVNVCSAVSDTGIASGSFTRPTGDSPATDSFMRLTGDSPATGSFMRPTGDSPATDSFMRPTGDSPAPIETSSDGTSPSLAEDSSTASHVLRDLVLAVVKTVNTQTSEGSCELGSADPPQTDISVTDKIEPRGAGVSKTVVIESVPFKDTTGASPEHGGHSERIGMLPMDTVNSERETVWDSSDTGGRRLTGKRKRLISEMDELFLFKRRSTRVRVTKKRHDDVIVTNYSKIVQKLLPKHRPTSSSKAAALITSENPIPIPAAPLHLLGVDKDRDCVTDTEREHVRLFCRIHQDLSCADLIEEFLLILAQQSTKIWYADLKVVYADLYWKYRRIINLEDYLLSGVSGREPACVSDEVCMNMADSALLSIELQLDHWISKQAQPAARSGRKSLMEKYPASVRLPLEEDLYVLDLFTCRSQILKQRLVSFSLRVYWVTACYNILLRRNNAAVRAFQEVRGCMLWSKDTDMGVESVFIHQRALDNVISMDTVACQIEAIGCCLSLSDLLKLFEEGRYEEVVSRVKPTLGKSTVDLKTLAQLRSGDKERSGILVILVNSLSHLSDHQETVSLCEECIHEAASHLTNRSSHTAAAASHPNRANKKEWIRSMARLCHGLSKCLREREVTLTHLPDDRAARLQDHMVAMIQDVLYDTEGDPPLNTDIHSWIIIYYIMKREESSLETEIIGDLTPSLSYLIAAHHCMGKHSLCLEKSGSFLLFSAKQYKQALSSLPAEADISTNQESGCSSDSEGSEVKGRSRSKQSEVKERLRQAFEQCIFCLFGYPRKRTKAKHLEDHGVKAMSLKWEAAMTAYEFFKPAELPGFDSYRTLSVSPEFSEFLKKMVTVIPDSARVTAEDTQRVTDYVSGILDNLDTTAPEKYRNTPVVAELYYLLSDYYFKNKEYETAINYYYSAICCDPGCFDSWAGLALSKFSQLEVTLNSYERQKFTGSFSGRIHSTFRCYRKALELDPGSLKLAIECGTAAYQVHMYLSHLVKQPCDPPKTESLLRTLRRRSEEMLSTAYEAFELHATYEPNSRSADSEDEEEEEEAWLSRYMLGKIGEKRGDSLELFLLHYEQAARRLYEDGARYPKRILASSTQQKRLAREALEMYYRLHVSVLKVLDSNPLCSVHSFLLSLLKRAATSPFVTMLDQSAASESITNKERSDPLSNEPIISGERRGPVSNEPIISGERRGPVSHHSEQTVPRVSSGQAMCVQEMTGDAVSDSNDVLLVGDSCSAGGRSRVDVHSAVSRKRKHSSGDVEVKSVRLQAGLDSQGRDTVPEINQAVQDIVGSVCLNVNQFPEQEAGNSPPGGELGNRAGDSSIGEEIDKECGSVIKELVGKVCSAVKEDSVRLASAEAANKEPMSCEDKDSLRDYCVKALRLCVARCPTHYKSLYHLAQLAASGHLFTNGGDNASAVKEILLGPDHMTGSAAEDRIVPQGLFQERKPNNFFNGIWRFDVPEIERAGSFPAHMARIIRLLLRVLRENQEESLLFHLYMQLRRDKPNSTRLFLREVDRKHLASVALSYCLSVYRHMVAKYTPSHTRPKLSLPASNTLNLPLSSSAQSQGKSGSVNEVASASLVMATASTSDQSRPSTSGSTAVGQGSEVVVSDSTVESLTMSLLRLHSLYLKAAADSTACASDGTEMTHQSVVEVERLLVLLTYSVTQHTGQSCEVRSTKDALGVCNRLAKSRGDQTGGRRRDALLSPTIPALISRLGRGGVASGKRQGRGGGRTGGPIPLKGTKRTLGRAALFASPSVPSATVSLTAAEGSVAEGSVVREPSAVSPPVIVLIAAPVGSDSVQTVGETVHKITSAGNAGSTSRSNIADTSYNGRKDVVPAPGGDTALGREMVAAMRPSDGNSDEFISDTVEDIGTVAEPAATEQSNPPNQTTEPNQTTNQVSGHIQPELVDILTNVGRMSTPTNQGAEVEGEPITISNPGNVPHGAISASLIPTSVYGTAVLDGFGNKNSNSSGGNQSVATTFLRPVSANISQIPSDTRASGSPQETRSCGSSRQPTPEKHSDGGDNSLLCPAALSGAVDERLSRSVVDGTKPLGDAPAMSPSVHSGSAAGDGESISVRETSSMGNEMLGQEADLIGETVRAETNRSAEFKQEGRIRSGCEVDSNKEQLPSPPASLFEGSDHGTYEGEEGDNKDVHDADMDSDVHDDNIASDVNDDDVDSEDIDDDKDEVTDHESDDDNPENRGHGDRPRRQNETSMSSGSHSVSDTDTKMSAVHSEILDSAREVDGAGENEKNYESEGEDGKDDESEGDDGKDDESEEDGKDDESEGDGKDDESEGEDGKDDESEGEDGKDKEAVMTKGYDCDDENDSLDSDTQDDNSQDERRPQSAGSSSSRARIVAHSARTAVDDEVISIGEDDTSDEEESSDEDVEEMSHSHSRRKRRRKAGDSIASGTENVASTLDDNSSDENPERTLHSEDEAADRTLDSGDDVADTDRTLHSEDDVADTDRTLHSEDDVADTDRTLHSEEDVAERTLHSDEDDVAERTLHSDEDDVAERTLHSDEDDDSEGDSEDEDAERTLNSEEDEEDSERESGDESEARSSKVKSKVSKVEEAMVEEASEDEDEPSPKRKMNRPTYNSSSSDDEDGDDDDDDEDDNDDEGDDDEKSDRRKLSTNISDLEEEDEEDDVSCDLRTAEDVSNHDSESDDDNDEDGDSNSDADDKTGGRSNGEDEKESDSDGKESDSDGKESDSDGKESDSDDGDDHSSEDEDGELFRGDHGDRKKEAGAASDDEHKMRERGDVGGSEVKGLKVNEAGEFSPSSFDDSAGESSTIRNSVTVSTLRPSTMLEGNTDSSDDDDVRSLDTTVVLHSEGRKRVGSPLQADYGSTDWFDHQDDSGQDIPAAPITAPSVDPTGPHSGGTPVSQGKAVEGLTGRTYTADGIPSTTTGLLECTHQDSNPTTSFGAGGVTGATSHEPPAPLVPAPPPVVSLGDALVLDDDFQQSTPTCTGVPFNQTTFDDVKPQAVEQRQISEDDEDDDDEDADAIVIISDSD